MGQSVSYSNTTAKLPDIAEDNKYYYVVMEKVKVRVYKTFILSKARVP